MKCFSCPRHCGAERAQSLAEGGGHGVCGMPRNPVVARAGLHYFEEPIISGKQGSGTVFFSGCNLRCAFCQNYQISSEQYGREITVDRLRAIYSELIQQGAHNINLVTPTHYLDVIAASLEPALPVPVVWNTNGYEDAEQLQKLAGKVQIYLPDLKYADADPAQKYSGVADYFPVASRAIDAMFEQTGPYRTGPDGLLESGVLIRHLILPGCIENSLRVIGYLAGRFRPGDVLFSLMRQYTPCGRVASGEFPELNRPVSDREYRTVEQALFDSGIEDGFVQSSRSSGTGFIPVFDGSGV